MTEVQIKMADLYDRLAGIGFPKTFLQQKILPDWWTRETDKDPDVVLEGAMYLANRLNVSVRSLLDADETVTFAPICQPKFKLKNGTDLQRLAIPRALSARVAELVAYGCKQPYLGLADWSIERIRERILQSRDAVDLAGFLEFCWSIGIPVVHFSAFPSGVQKFQGMVAYYGDRPVILLSLKHKSLARLLFIAAHEMGHLLKGHVTQNEPLIDEQVDMETDDDDEDEANQVARELLIGRSGMSYDIWRHFVSGEQLVAESRRLAQHDPVDPGVVALNITWNRAKRACNKNDKNMIWGVGSKALKILEPNGDAPNMINRVLCEYMDWEKLGEDTTEYLTTMLNLDVAWFE
jgi:IrrE N-terminal-like domain